MKRIAAVALLYVIAALPAAAAEDNVYAFPVPDTDAPLPPDVAALKSELARLTWFSLLHEADSFSIYGGLFIPRLHADGAEAGVRRNAPTYGLHAQLYGSPGIGVRFSWDRDVAGGRSGDNRYSLSATIKF